MNKGLARLGFVAGQLRREDGEDVDPVAVEQGGGDVGCPLVDLPDDSVGPAEVAFAAGQLDGLEGRPLVSV